MYHLIKESPKALFEEILLTIVSLNFNLKMWYVPPWLINIPANKILMTVIPYSDNNPDDKIL